MAFSFFISAARQFVVRYKRRVGLFAASVITNGVVLMFAVWMTESENKQTAPLPINTAIDFIEIELAEDTLQTEEKILEPKLDVKPRARLQEAPLTPELAQDNPEAAAKPLEAVSEKVVIPDPDPPLNAEESDAKRRQTEGASEKWQVDRAGLTLEEQATGIFIPRTPAGSGLDGDLAFVRRALGYAACLDIETARKAGSACAELGAIARYMAEPDIRARINSENAAKFSAAGDLPFVKRESFDLFKGPLPEVLSGSMRGGGVGEGGLPDPHPHAYDEVTRP